MNKKYLLLVGAVALIAGGVIIYDRTDLLKKAGQDSEQSRNQSEPEGGDIDPLRIVQKDHVLGDPEAQVTIVEYSDFQCPYCQRFHSTVKKAMEEYPDEVRLVYRHFPLGFHSQALPSALASECAAEQGFFGEFIDGLFENQSRLGKELYSELARDLGLDTDKFEECFSSEKYLDKIQEDVRSGKKAGVSGTPGSFVNGEELRGAVPYAELKEAIDKNL